MPPSWPSWRRTSPPADHCVPFIAISHHQHAGELGLSRSPFFPCDASDLPSVKMGFDKGYWSTPEHVITAAIGLAVLDITFLTLRFVSRRKQRQPLKTDDWILIPAIVGFTSPDPDTYSAMNELSNPMYLQLFTLGISISMVYGVSRKAIGYPYVIPPEAQGNALLVTTEQIRLAGQVLRLFDFVTALRRTNKPDRSNGHSICSCLLHWDARK